MAAPLQDFWMYEASETPYNAEWLKKVQQYDPNATWVSNAGAGEDPSANRGGIWYGGPAAEYGGARGTFTSYDNNKDSLFDPNLFYEDPLYGKITPNTNVKNAPPGWLDWAGPLAVALISGGAALYAGGFGVAAGEAAGMAAGEGAMLGEGLTGWEALTAGGGAGGLGGAGTTIMGDVLPAGGATTAMGGAGAETFGGAAGAASWTDKLTSGAKALVEDLGFTKKDWLSMGIKGVEAGLKAWGAKEAADMKEQQYEDYMEGKKVAPMKKYQYKTPGIINQALYGTSGGKA